MDIFLLYTFVESVHENIADARNNRTNICRCSTDGKNLLFFFNNDFLMLFLDSRFLYQETLDKLNVFVTHLLIHVKENCSTLHVHVLNRHFVIVRHQYLRRYSGVSVVRAFAP